MTDYREINFDMDGTIADLYGVEGWLDYLMNKDVTPYANAKALVNLSALARVLNRLQKMVTRFALFLGLQRSMMIITTRLLLMLRSNGLQNIFLLSSGIKSLSFLTEHLKALAVMVFFSMMKSLIVMSGLEMPTM